MKKACFSILIVLLICGCSNKTSPLDGMMALRADLLQSAGCCFDAEITADYGNEIYQFSVACQADEQGNLSFTVKEPSCISGINGKITYEGGKLVYDDLVLAFPMQVDGMVSPACAPWVLMKALREGYVEHGMKDGEVTRISVYDSYQDDALRLELWLTQACVPIQADIYEDSRRILTVEIKNFTLM